MWVHTQRCVTYKEYLLKSKSIHPWSVPVFGSIWIGGIPMWAGGGWGNALILGIINDNGEPGCGPPTIDTLLAY